MPSQAPEAQAHFKVCTMCGANWQTRSEFLADPLVVTIGYQANFKQLTLGLFFFNHEACKTTLAIKASLFTDLHSGTMFRERLTGTRDCPGYCTHKNELRPCPAQCECAYVRDVLDQVTHWNGRVPA